MKNEDAIVREALVGMVDYSKANIGKMNAVLKALNDTGDDELIAEVAPAIRERRRIWIELLMDSRRAVRKMDRCGQCRD